MGRLKFYCWVSEMVIGGVRCKRLHAIGWNKEKADEFRSAGLPVNEYDQPPDALHSDGMSNWIERR